MTIPLCQCYVDELSVQHYFSDPIRSDCILWARFERTRGKGDVYNSRFPVRIPRRCGYRQLRCARPSACARESYCGRRDRIMYYFSEPTLHFVCEKRKKIGPTVDGNRNTTCRISKFSNRVYVTDRLLFEQTRRLHDPIPAMIRSFNFRTITAITTNTIVL